MNRCRQCGKQISHPDPEVVAACTQEGVCWSCLRDVIEEFIKRRLLDDEDGDQESRSEDMLRKPDHAWERLAEWERYVNDE